MEFIIYLIAWSSSNPAAENKEKGFWRCYQESICEHPYNEKNNSIIAKTREPKNKENTEDFNYIVRVNECSFCGKHFIDEGLEFKDQSWK
jgi:hypothetical protein